jgi:hypothetical protein
MARKIRIGSEDEFNFLLSITPREKLAELARDSNDRDPTVRSVGRAAKELMDKKVKRARKKIRIVKKETE